MKRKFNIDGQLFQPKSTKTNNHLSPQIIEHKSTAYGVGNLGPGLAQTQMCVCVSWS